MSHQRVEPTARSAHDASESLGGWHVRCLRPRSGSGAYARVAAELHEHGLFFTVDAMEAKAFCKEQVRVKLPGQSRTSHLTSWLISSHLISPHLM
jgi:hypothetical protein